MLSDIERKVLRIISNYELGRKRTPSIEELCIKTGRSVNGIKEILFKLKKEAYIKWSPSKPDDIIILERWERRNGWVAL